MIKNENAPIVIIGGGPAGSTMGCYLSQAGVPNVLFESAVHPRPHVGESLVPSTYKQFAEIGFVPIMEQEGFVRKYGASWHPPQRAASLAIEFKEFPQPGVDQDYTWHVDRSKFDLLLLKHAETKGTKVYQGVRVKEVLFEDDYACGVRVSIADRTVDVPARFIVDASGRDTLLGRQLGWKRSDPQFNQFAVHSWFEGVDRGERPDDIHIHFLPVERGWVWQIPITQTITSIGVVAEKKVFQQSRKDYGGWFRELITSAPDIARAMRKARRLREYKVEADYTYAMKNFVGNGFALIGDAARFVDPIFSSGVSIALASARFASAQILECLRNGDTSKEALMPYEQKLRRGTTVWYEFICLYYRLLPTFTRFIQSPTYRHQVLQLLQGEVYERQEVPVLDAMRRFIARVEEAEGHVLQAALDRHVQVIDSL